MSTSAKQIKIKTKRKIDMTSGPLFGKIVLFVLPMMVTNLLQVAYNAADMMIVSMSSEPNAVGAVGSTGAFINLIINLFVGFATGANVVIARHIGAKEEREVSRSVHTSLMIGVILGFICAAIGIPLARPVLSLMGADGTILDLAVRYTVIYFAGVPFISLTNYAVAILRSKGDTQTPLYVMTLSGLLNVGLNFFFVLACGMSVEGVAIATVISNIASAIALLFIMSRDSGPCRFSFGLLRFDRRAFANILRIGLPAGIQGSLFSLSNMLIQSSVFRMNEIIAPGYDYKPVVEGHSAVGNLENFIYTATNSVSQAAVAFTSQNVGACKYDRIKRVMLNCYLISMTTGLVLSGVVLLFHRPLLALYGVSGGDAGSLAQVAFETAWKRLLVVTAPYALLAFMEVGSGTARGLGRSMTSTVISLIGACLLRIVWILTIFNSITTLECLYVSYPISWAATGIVLLAVDLIIVHRDKRKYARMHEAVADVAA